ncbi:hypothetical protein DW083_08490 [Parabacteroides sp. AF48-14]|uniref:hypothetical protein n=1 Tax=Parabacteroides sp. AF48-14 TaxID=2292052 RepID=UPI000FF36341|nr:hypothetical protein [Parabacteroides sp. AF48-14]RHO72635.1 hypothetical protein DW083_08490 [Parabacteroides sp. AF48-14]
MQVIEKFLTFAFDQAHQKESHFFFPAVVADRIADIPANDKAPEVLPSPGACFFVCFRPSQGYRLH